ncbi:hypothetical protein FOXG_14828 [Fusarium oxysporum f. sp. lycopersici 4287]|uniref:Chromo domain-containing protein n=1 Tax=Fusarium oxysporum f. sp. lycopersici (strain 4287 / CBS 123668 / FGSC 9935 / NRRL 34936) TaxID=426428 RepID=A0A0J9W1Q2_FUSO4|nr:hypothetical protein FOXG_14828 [Fusarium oxysporum f. sp. lycopersici 4287]KNB16745.1 hypothetical protein FOXG_14828 [Fusarium oxysporum f. sp. lycopersici 4287]
MAKTDDNHENDSIYLVDSIQDHFVDEDGCMYFQVKWQGHESSKEWTWEPQTNLEIEDDMLVKEYFESLAKRRKRVRRSVKKQPSPSVATRGIGCGRRNERHRTVPSGRTAKLAWEPPRGSWEHEPFHIDGCEGDNAETLMIYITWLGGHKTRHKVDVLCKKCPQKMLRYLDQYVSMS